MQSVLMLSSSRVNNEPYLEHTIPIIDSHFSSTDLRSKNIVFIPYAGVTMSHDEYTGKVRSGLPGFNISGIQEYHDPNSAISKADAVMVGGGNTFRLLQLLYQNELLNSLKSRVNSGMPYIGWSAGSNVCGLTIRTTNDMPIIEPPSFNSLGFVGCQLNPHYTDYHPPRHNGETRDQRLAEFTTLNPDVPVIAIREGTALSKNGDSVKLVGELGGFVFLSGQKIPVSPGDDLTTYCA